MLKFITILSSKFVSIAKNSAKMTSIHSAYKEEVHDIPMSVIIRPFIPELDENKVQSLMETIKVLGKANQLIRGNVGGLDD
ncbi:unnamed protein product [Parnassius apollo]|uniref:(apollo) hypothetical protein n=1 Tax=Parnassius apollo TaxID=110799 RepID=A0A8S3XW11_PARAO|nr:unnamed protein product [Parnassius apollo]